MKEIAIAGLHRCIEGERPVLVLEARPLEASVPCQPADALALAIRLRIPVLATETLLRILEHQAIETDRGPLPSDAVAAPWLKSVTPDEFATQRPGHNDTCHGGACDG